MNLKYKILAVLAAGIALTACGGSGTPASTPASSAVPASSHVAEEGVTEPINLLTWTLDDLDDTQTTTFVSASITSGVQDGKLTAKVFSYDLYKKEEIENLAVGDKITFHEEGAAWNQVVNNAVTSIEKNDEYHLVSINGGMEQPGGLDLKLEDDDTYRTMTFDDYPLYYEMALLEAELARTQRFWAQAAGEMTAEGHASVDAWAQSVTRCRACLATCLEKVAGEARHG